MKQRLLITGGTGFLGYHIINKAVEQGLEVFVATRQSSVTGHLKGIDVKYMPLNLGDSGVLKQNLEEKQFDFILHAAGSTRAPSQQQYNLVNAVYTANLARAANDADIPLKKFVFVSSLAAIGPAPVGDTIDGNKKMQPVTAYGESKKLAEKMLGEIPGLPLIIFRPTAVYGPREKDILIVLKTFNRGFEPYIGNKPQELSFIYAKDLAELLINSLHSSIIGKAYNISDGEVYSRFALADITKKILHKKTLRLQLPVGLVKLVASILEKAGSINGTTPPLNREKIEELTASWVCSIEEAKIDFGFKPRYNLENGLKETLDWYKANNWL
jgi:nucleoside-diphosphate-sugar epimerase